MPIAYFGTLTYTVVAGDTLSKIAHDYNSTVENISIYNSISNPNLIKVGQTIIIPLSPTEAIIYTVKAGDSLYFIAKKYGTSVNNLIKYNYILRPPYYIYPGEHLVVTASLR
jgi:LysM repeat protein